MRGRAGRRGFDNVGYTIFCYFSLLHVVSLLLSPMQPLLAIPALNIDSVLRAIILQNKVKDKDSSFFLLPVSPLTICRAVRRWLYTHPSVDTLKEANPPVIFLFSIELLFRLHLINKQVCLSFMKFIYLIVLFIYLLLQLIHDIVAVTANWNEWPSCT